MALPRARLPAVVDAIRGRDAMDDSTSVPKKNCRPRAAVRKEGRDCGQHRRGGVGVDGAKMLQREETSVTSPVITARKRSRKGATSVLPVTSGTPPRCATSLHHAAVILHVDLLLPRHTSVPVVLVVVPTAAGDVGTKRIAVLSAPTRYTNAVVHGVRWLLEGNVLTT